MAAPTLNRMAPETFEAVRDAITEAAHQICPTRFNGRSKEFGHAMTAIYAKFGVTQKQYLEEIGYRSPSKHA